MRITDSMSSAFWQNSMNSSLSNLNTIQEQISTGLKINQPSDNPAGTAEAMSIGSAMAQNQQYQTNVTSAQSMLSTTSGALQTVSNILLSARQIASEGANSTDSSTYQSLVQQVQALTTQLVGVANTQNGSDEYVFGGTATKTPPYTQYAQPSTAPTVADDNATTGNFPAGSYYVSYSYTYANGGVSPASTPAQVTTASNNDSIDVSGVSALPTGATGVNVYVGTSANSMTLAQNFSSNSPITVTTAPVNGAAAAPGLEPVYAGNSGALTSTVGTNTTIQTNTPGNTIFDPIFTALSNLQQDLQTAGGTSPAPTSAITALSNDLTSIDSASTTVSTTSAEVGAKIDLLQSQTTQLTSQSTQYSSSLSNIEDVDLATAYVQLQASQNTYQAALDATSKAYQYSLVDYMSNS